jgi:hypothetical protein
MIIPPQIFCSLVLVVSGGSGGEHWIAVDGGGSGVPTGCDAGSGVLQATIK